MLRFALLVIASLLIALTAAAGELAAPELPMLTFTYERPVPDARVVDTLRVDASGKVSCQLAGGGMATGGWFGTFEFNASATDRSVAEKLAAAIAALPPPGPVPRPYQFPNPSIFVAAGARQAAFLGSPPKPLDEAQPLLERLLRQALAHPRAAARLGLKLGLPQQRPRPALVIVEAQGTEPIAFKFEGPGPRLVSRTGKTATPVAGTPVGLLGVSRNRIKDTAIYDGLIVAATLKPGHVAQMFIGTLPEDAGPDAEWSVTAAGTLEATPPSAALSSTRFEVSSQ